MRDQIDRSKAPEWATKYGVAGRSKIPSWFNDTQYTYVNGYRGEPFLFGDQSRFARNNYEFTVLSERPTTPSWSGEGLPPVGVVCEVDYCEQWHPCEIIAHFQQRCGMVAAFTVDIVNGAKSLDAFGEGSFRPIRTPEQIAVDEREAAIKEMMQHSSLRARDGAKQVFGELYDAGYRKEQK